MDTKQNNSSVGVVKNSVEHADGFRHIVRFYEDDDLLADSLAYFFSSGISAGEACILIATKEHRRILEERLETYGMNTVRAKAEGQYVALDAAEMLSRFMVNGSPDPAMFAEVISDTVSRVSEGGRRVRAFGEMVALLWSQGNRQAAIDLEELWNLIGKTHTFSLLCAYPARQFADEAHRVPFAEICAHHTRVISDGVFPGDK